SPRRALVRGPRARRKRGHDHARLREGALERRGAKRGSVEVHPLTWPRNSTWRRRARRSSGLQHERQPGGEGQGLVAVDRREPARVAARDREAPAVEEEKVEAGLATQGQPGVGGGRRRAAGEGLRIGALEEKADPGREPDPDDAPSEREPGCEA